MSCNRFETKLSALIDGELSGRELQAVRDHLRACPDCAKARAELLGLKAAVSQLGPVSPSDQLEARLRRAIAESKAAPPRALKVALALGSMVAIGAGALVLSSAQAEQRRQDFAESRVRELAMQRELERDRINLVEMDSMTGASVGHLAGHTP